MLCSWRQGAQTQAKRILLNNARNIAKSLYRRLIGIYLYRRTKWHLLHLTRFCPVNPVTRIHTCMGGQSDRAARQIADRLQKIPHKTYVEPMVGLGKVTRFKAEVDKEVLNDKSCTRVREAKARICHNASKEQCERIKQRARVTCGRDYRAFLKQYDKKDTLIYLDPPYKGKSVNWQNYKHDGNTFDFSAFIKAVKQVKKASVAVSYSDDKDFKKALCGRNSGFRCVRIKKNYFAVHYNDILAIRTR